MPRSTVKLEIILLGLIAIDPRTGYDLKKAMENTIMYISPVSLSQIYPTLKRMTANGHIEFENIERSGGTPDRKVYTITESGLKEFLAWLSDPHIPSPNRYDGFLLKFFFSGMLDNKTFRQHVHAEIDFRKQQLAVSQEAAESPTTELNPIAIFDLERAQKRWGLYLEYGQRYLTTYISWLEDVLAQTGE